MVKIGVLGAGFLGKIHIRLIKQISDFELIGFYDSDPEVVKKTIEEFGIKAFRSAGELINAADAIDIVTPTTSHFEHAVAAIKSSKHIFIEKPITYSIDEAKKLVKLTNEANIVAQAGHVERFNPGFLAAKPSIQNPMFIEAHRLGQFNPRGTDVPVVLDLMIHDIDIVLSIVPSSIRKISASGVPVISDTPDIANARLEFDNGAVANLTASRISLSKMRKCRIFQRDTYISIDFLNKDTELFHIRNFDPSEKQPVLTINPGNGKDIKGIVIDKPVIVQTNAIQEELRCFHASIVNNTPPAVSIEDGYSALDLALKILDIMGNNTIPE
ncbi:MAG: Gfo/Idh/MocA family oxidoreductase [Bacteroidota bacterium]|nr:Gfo/Idh/MocA family oxidoreductase [Bacteroidota bacterium]